MSAPYRKRYADAAGVTEPPEWDPLPLWVSLAAWTIKPDPREMLTHKEEDAIVRLLELLRDAGTEVQEALVAANALGGDEACAQFVDSFLRECRV